MYQAQLEKADTSKPGFVPPLKPRFEASYKVAYRVARNRKSHTSGESLIKPCELKMVELVRSLEQRKTLKLTFVK